MEFVSIHQAILPLLLSLEKGVFSCPLPLKIAIILGVVVRGIRVLIGSDFYLWSNYIDSLFAHLIQHKEERVLKTAHYKLPPPFLLL